MVLAVAVVVVPIVVVFGIVRLAALKRPKGIKNAPQVDEWLASDELHKPT